MELYHNKKFFLITAINFSQEEAWYAFLDFFKQKKIKIGFESVRIRRSNTFDLKEAQYAEKHGYLPYWRWIAFEKQVSFPKIPKLLQELKDLEEEFADSQPADLFFLLGSIHADQVLSWTWYPRPLSIPVYKPTEMYFQVAAERSSGKWKQNEYSPSLFLYPESLTFFSDVLKIYFEV
ncbi:MAG: hypothetical protein D6767_07170 [Candidatus Hydrogenedentota bacterium]|nr:MAG: hypothetical protein D6767_07170 [Candidatus Hydrogenedentota bacterium]